jgi:endonuclease-3
MNQQGRKRLLSTLEKAYPNAKTELEYTSPFELLIAVMLSAQMTDKGVNKATAVLFPVANTPEKILALGEEKLLPYLKSINLYRTKTQHVLATCQLLLEKHEGQVPNSRTALEALPGVGRKTANVVLSVVFNQPMIAVDTHVFRVCNRTQLAKGKTPLEVENQLLKVVPEALRADAHHWLILHGRYVCKAKKPACSSCILLQDCGFGQKNKESAGVAE